MTKLDIETPGIGVKWEAPRYLWFLVLPAVLGLIGYGFVLHDFFLADDFSMLLYASSARSWTAVFSQGGPWDEQWIRPLGLLAWWLNLQLFGLEPFGYHLFNLAFHVLNAALLAWLVFVLTGHALSGTIAGAAFAVLPNHPEAVTWISGRFDVLATSGVLASLLAWTRYLGVDGKPWQLALAILAYVGALLSKEMALCAPLMYVGLALWYFRPLSRRAWWGLVALAAVTVVYLGMRFELLGGMGGLPDEQGGSTHLHPSLGRLTHFAEHALASVVAPLNREVYPFPFHPLQIVPMLGMAVVLALCFRARGWKGGARDLAPFALAFLASLLPLAGWARLYLDNQQSRFLYLPSAFSCATIGASCAFLRAGASKRYARSAGLAVGIVIATWCVGLVLENQHWHRAASTTRRMIETFPPPVPGASGSVFVADLPDNYCGAYIFRNSFHRAAELFTAHGEGVLPVHSPADATPRKDELPSVVYRWSASDEQWR